MPANFMPTAADYQRVMPELILIVFGAVLMVLQGLLEGRSRGILRATTMIAFIAALAGCFVAYSNPGPAFQGMLLVDGFATFFRVLVISVGLLTLLCSERYLVQENAERGEYYTLVLFSVTGQCLMACSNELMMIFIGLEISSIATYILAGYLRDDRRNNEAALKYFLLGSFATAFLLFGVAWIYGIASSTNLTEIRRAVMEPSSDPIFAMLGAAAALIFVGLAFKVSAAPFQIWAPDVYQGAPAPVSAFLSAGPKAAAFAVLLRIYMTAFEPISSQWEPIMWACAVLTMLVGNFAALTQNNIKRLLAYSSIAHAGYVMVAVTTHSEVGTAAAMFYLASYAFMNVGAFAVVTHFARKREQYLAVDDMAGIGFEQPVTAGLLTVFLLSLIGVPLTGGFFGKFYVFKAALDANMVWLTVFGLLNSAVAAFYYLRIIAVMYMREPSAASQSLPAMDSGIKTALWLSAAAVIVLGVAPSFVLDFAGQSAKLIK